MRDYENYATKSELNLLERLVLSFTVAGFIGVTAGFALMGLVVDQFPRVEEELRDRGAIEYYLDANNERQWRLKCKECQE